MEANLSGGIGIGLMLGLGAVMLSIALLVKRHLVRTTHDFIIANRQISLGFGIGSVISVWTWSMAVMLSSASAYTWGTSGLMWFVVPNGLAVVALVPFAVYMRKRMPAGYTLVQYIRERFQSKTAYVLSLVSLTFLLLSVIIINLFGVVLVTGVIFGLNPTAVLLLTIGIIALYAYFGGLWTSTITATLGTFLVSVPGAIVVLYVFTRVGGASTVFTKVQDLGPEYTNLFRGETAAQFGVSLGLGLLANTVTDQSFWQRVWGMKPANLARTFMWAGLWFYPIPLTLGLLGFVGLANGVTLDDLGTFGAGGVGPYVISHLGLPVVIIAMYVLVVLTACFAASDGAFAGLAGIVSVDVIRRIRPQVKEKTLFRLTKLSIPVSGLIAAGVVLSGFDYVALVTFIYFLDISLLIPVTLAIFWSRYSSHAFIAATLLAAIIGVWFRQNVGVLEGIIALLGTSAVVSLVVSLASRQRFDYEQLQRLAEQAPAEYEGRARTPEEAPTV